jgi:hypothetical protein
MSLYRRSCPSGPLGLRPRVGDPNVFLGSALGLGGFVLKVLTEGSPSLTHEREKDAIVHFFLKRSTWFLQRRHDSFRHVLQCPLALRYKGFDVFLFKGNRLLL